MLTQLLNENRAAILKEWFDLIINSYPSDTARFLKKEKDRFQNPVGHTLHEETGNLFDRLVAGDELGTMVPSVDNIVRIRAVQDFEPSQAVAVIFVLKQAVRVVLGPRIEEPERLRELLEFESRIDRLGLATFDCYVQCREKIHEIRINEIKNRSSMLFERMQGHREEPVINNETDNSNIVIRKKGGDGS